jgi:hypothetical protein
MFVDRGTDERSPIARRLRDLVRLHTLDISPNGAEQLSAAQAQLIRRISMIEVQAELMEAKMVAGDDTVDVESFARISSHLRRMYESLGLRKTKRDETPSLDELIKHRAEKSSERVKLIAAATVANASSTPVTDRADPAARDAEPIEEAVS